jgi:nitric oxide reductase subunit B
METTAKRGFLLARGSIQAVILVFLFGFFVLGFLAYRTYTGEPPIPGKVVDPNGHLLFTGANIMAGQGTFLRNGLMEYGSIFSHGAYLGPDFTADYLHRAAVLSIDFYAGLGSDKARAATIADCKTNRYDSATDTLTFPVAQAHSYQESQKYYHAFFAEPTTKYGLRADAITHATDTQNLTAFFAWSAWCASALRPGLAYSYTNNWPPEPLVDNHPTADTVVWSVLSLVTLLGGIGLLLAAFGRWNFLGWHGRERDKVFFRPPGDVVLTPAQRACA